MNIKMLKAAVAGLVLSVSGLANAGIIKNVAGIENLEWLDFSYSLNLSRDELDVLFLNDASYQGMRFASITEVGLLLNSYPGVQTVANPSGWHNEMGVDSTMFFTEFGLLEGSMFSQGQYLRSGFKFGLDDECGLNITCAGWVHGTGDGQGASTRGYYYKGYGWNVENINEPWKANDSVGDPWGTGHAALLVRATDVPEPSTLAIFALGIMGLASRRFKKQ